MVLVDGRVRLKGSALKQSVFWCEEKGFQVFGPKGRPRRAEENFSWEETVVRTAVQNVLSRFPTFFGPVSRFKSTAHQTFIIHFYINSSRCWTSDVSEELLIFEALKFLTERIEFLVTYGCDRMLKVYFWLVPCGSTNSCTFCLIFFFLKLITVFIFERHLIDVSYEVTAAGYWGRLDWSALMEQRRAMKRSHWVSLTTCLEAPGPFCSLSRVRVTDLCWGLLSRRSVVKLCVMIEGQRRHLCGKTWFLRKLLPSPPLHVDTFANPDDKWNAAACDFSFYHSNSTHWCSRLWLTGKLERVAIAISPHQLRLWPWTIVSLFRFSHS